MKQIKENTPVWAKKRDRKFLDGVLVEITQSNMFVVNHNYNKKDSRLFTETEFNDFFTTKKPSALSNLIGDAVAYWNEDGWQFAALAAYCAIILFFSSILILRFIALLKVVF